MATFKMVILPHQKKEDGSYNIKIRVTHNRKTKYIKTPYYAKCADISKRKGDLKVKNQSIVDAVEGVMLEYRKRLLPFGMAVDAWSIDRIVSYLSEDSGKCFTLDFLKYGHDCAEAMEKDGRKGTAGQYRIAFNALGRFVGRDNLDISEINLKFIRAFEKYLRDEPVYRGTRDGKSVPTGIRKKGRALPLYMSTIKTVYNAAKMEYNDEDNGIVNIPYSPFDRYKIPPTEPSAHRTLTIGQIQAIIDFPYEKRQGSVVNLGKDCFVLSFVLMGINSADLYEAASIQDGVLVYNRRKTRTRRSDKAEMRVRIEPCIGELVKKYQGKELAFCFAEKYAGSEVFNQSINRGLAKIGEKIGVPALTYYYARHSMASICANKLGVDIARVDEMLNHADPRLSLARVYIERDFTPLWEANEKLMGLFDWAFYKTEAEE